jgi:hypothetical protein
MTTKADYTEDEWAALRLAPILAGMAVSLADPGGPLEAPGEIVATVRAVADTPPTGETELAGAVATDVRELAEHRGGLAAELHLEPRTAGLRVHDELARVNAILAAKSTPEEAAAFKRWLLEAARHAAEASKGGGLQGPGVGRVSEADHHALDELAQLLAVPPA